MLGLRR